MDNYYNYWLQALNNIRGINPQYTPNPAFNTGMAFGGGANPFEKGLAIGDLTAKTFVDLMTQITPKQTLPARPLPERQPERAMAQDGLQMPVIDFYQTTEGLQQQQIPGAVPNEVINNTENIYGTVPSPEMVRITPTLDIRESEQRAENQNPNNGADILSTAAQLGSYGFDMAKDVLAGMGVARRSQYLQQQAQDRLRQETIQGQTKGREALFNQGYMQTTNFMAQDGGNIPVSSQGLYEYPNQEVMVPSNNITMEGIGYPVMAFPDGDTPVMMQPGQNYLFPNSTQVLEQPIQDDIVMLEDGMYYNKRTKQFITA